MGCNFDNFISGLAFGMFAGNPFFRGMGCGCGFGFGGFSNTVDFGTFANPFPTIFPPMQNNSMSVAPLLTNFANPGFPTLDFTGPCQTIWDTFTNPDSEYNKQLRELYKQAEENSNTNNNQKRQQYIPQIQFPFSSFFMPPQVAMNPYISGYIGDTFTSKRTTESKKSEEPKETDSDTVTKTYTSKYSNDKYFSKMLSFVLEHEGGYVNHPHDKGGATNMGVTQKTYDNYRKQKGLSTRTVKQLTKDEATEIYHNNYVASGADKITNPKLAMCVFDWANHSGPENETLQRSLKECNGDVDKFIKMRSDFLHRIIEKDPTQEDFRKGWDNRIKDLRAYVTEFPSNYA